VADKEEKLSQEELADELLISQNKFMECSICEQQISYCNQNDEERMEEHFREEHGYNDEEET
jgi:hypothetical protein